MKIKFTAKVIRIEEKFNKVYVMGVGENAKFNNISRGWFISFEGSYESLYFGIEKPVANVGDVATIEITI